MRWGNGFFFLLGFNPVYYLAWQTNALILLTLFYPLLSLFYVWRAFCCSLSFIETKSSDCVSYIIFIISGCHNLLTVVLSAIGLWLNSGERGIVCAKAESKWVTIEPVLTLLPRTFGPNTAGSSSTQHCKKSQLHYSNIITTFFLIDLIGIEIFGVHAKMIALYFQTNTTIGFFSMYGGL